MKDVKIISTNWHMHLSQMILNSIQSLTELVGFAIEHRERE
jgi:hypothetical protein